MPVPEYWILQQNHRDAWSSLWQTDIEIEGDPEIQQFVHAGLFYLWSSMQERDRWSIAPMGLSSNGYNGHIFWDAELWMYPSLLVTHPELALDACRTGERRLPVRRTERDEAGTEGRNIPGRAASPAKR